MTTDLTVRNKPANYRQRETACGDIDINVVKNERLASIAGGLATIYIGAQGRPIPRFICFAIGAGLLYRGMTGKCSLYQAIGANTNTCFNANQSIRNKRGVQVVESITIHQPVNVVYREWRDFEKLPRFLRHIASVKMLDEKRSRWTIDTAVGSVQWTATIIEDRPNEIISWKTTDDADVDCAGSVRFRALSKLNATEMTANLRYDFTGAWIGSWITSFFGESPEDMIREDLRRFKQIVETGEVPTIEGQPSGYA